MSKITGFTLHYDDGTSELIEGEGLIAIVVEEQDEALEYVFTKDLDEDDVADICLAIYSDHHGTEDKNEDSN